MATTSSCFVSVLLVAVVSYVIGSPCNEDWIYNDGTCYGFGSSTVSWTEATAICSLFKSSLAEVRSQAKSDFLKLELRLHKVRQAWIGGTDMFHNSTWQWIGSKEELGPFSDWYPGDFHYDEEDNCLVMISSRDFQWSQDRCNQQYNFVCETHCPLRDSETSPTIRQVPSTLTSSAVRPHEYNFVCQTQAEGTIIG